MNRCHRPYGPATLALLFCFPSAGCENQAPQGDPAAGKDGATQKADDEKTAPTSRKTTSYFEGDLTYPRDKDLLMATVNGRKVTLDDIATHIDSRHFPGFKHLISSKFGQRELRIPRMADWNRQYADILALRAEARRLGIKEGAIKSNLGEVFLEAFNRYKASYEERERRPFPSSEKGVKAMQKRFLKSRGLGLEVHGLLNSLVQDTPMTRPEINEFYKRYSESMNGLLKISQIFIQNRDKRTGALLRGEEAKKVQAKVKKIKGLLAKDGSNFETIAASYSENQTSARRNGILNNLNRFDPRVPASICRAAWNLRNGQWEGPLQSRYGIHFVKRIEWTITKMIVNPDPMNTAVRTFVRSHRQEALLFQIREKAKVELHY